MSVHAVSAALAQLRRLPGVSTARDLAEAKPAFPVVSGLRSVFPTGLPRGEITEIVGPQALSLALASVARLSTEDCWTAAVGVGEPAVQAIADYGVSLSRFASIEVDTRDWLRAVSILVESFSAVIVRPGFSLTPAEQARLRAKVRERNMSLLVVGRSRQPKGIAGSTVSVTSPRWTGLAQGAGALSECTVTVHRGRDRVQLLLPGPSGCAEERGFRLV
ncbi:MULTISPECIES: hypothetical protein [unclassified Brevibacterium]|uniref:hypothetical protein n=1 Tax=unclassified Brevibacterium TaxID=2614124 RepID=UPI0008A5C860|nr:MULTISPECIES: hypothetical protein [unclassified Brevibacterium]OFS26422.1 hypothetical protein HMPREF3162_06520 [Brevibacterium sp. HMSC07C04]